MKGVGSRLVRPDSDNPSDNTGVVMSNVPVLVSTLPHKQLTHSTTFHPVRTCPTVLTQDPLSGTRAPKSGSGYGDKRSSIESTSLYLATKTAD